MLKVTGRAMPAAPGLLPFTVSADGQQDAAAAAAAAPLHRDQLSLYSAPPQLKSRYVEPEAGQLEQSVATLRRTAEPYTDWCQDKIKPKVQSVIQFGSSAFDYLRNPPKEFYPRAGVIGFTGVLGLFLGRGSRIKKLIYPAGLMTLSASLYYPEQAADIAKSTGDSVYEQAVQSYAALQRMNPQRMNPQSKAAQDPEPKP